MWPALTAFLGQNYCFKSIDTYIFDAMMLALHGSHTMAKNSSPTRNETNTVMRSISSKQYALNCVIMGWDSICSTIARELFLT